MKKLRLKREIKEKMFFLFTISVWAWIILVMIGGGF